MSATAATATEKKQPQVNRLGLEKQVYGGLKSTLCKGCGHDSITGSIIQSLYEFGVKPHMVAKLSGIGCSSKTTAYFLGESHGFNAVHGRMAAIATGVAAANCQLVNIGVSGDGDTASIGIANFMHMIRRNVPIIYILENNGCYGLTKGQFSATADPGSVLKNGVVNSMPSIDLCAIAIQMGCGYVGRSFSGDRKQVQALLKGALAHRGSTLIDIVSPCVTFNNHEGSTKSFQYAKNHEDPLHEMGFVPYFDDISVDYNEGETLVVEMHDGSKITLKKLGHDYDPTDRGKAVELLHKAQVEQHFYTGLIYYNREMASFHDQMNMIEEPLATLPENVTRPPNTAFDEIMESFK